MRTPSGGAKRVEAPVGRDAVQPGPERRADLERADVLPGGKERLLDRVLRVLSRAEDPIAVHLQLPPVPADQLRERTGVPGLGSDDQISLDGNPSFLAQARCRVGSHRYRRRGKPESGSACPLFSSPIVYPLDRDDLGWR